MPREIRVSVQMDRAVGATISPTDLQALHADVQRDNQLLSHFRRARGCGCAGCQAQAKAARWNIRGAELPQDQAGVTLDPFRKGSN